MFEKTIDTDIMEVEFSADPMLLEELAVVIRQFLDSRNVEDSNDFQLVMAQILENAIVHGSGGDPEKNIRLELEDSGQGRFILIVEDQGPGFDHATLMKELEDPFSDCVGGLAIIQSFTDKMEFNKSGNRITVQATLTTGQDQQAEQPMETTGGDLPEPVAQDKANDPEEDLPEQNETLAPEPGCLDREMALAVMARAQEAINSGQEEFVLDLEGITTMTAHGLNLIMALKKHFSDDTGSRFKIANIDQGMSRLLSILGIPA